MFLLLSLGALSSALRFRHPQAAGQNLAAGPRGGASLSTDSSGRSWLLENAVGTDQRGGLGDSCGLDHSGCSRKAPKWPWALSGRSHDRVDRLRNDPRVLSPELQLARQPGFDSRRGPRRLARPAPRRMDLVQPGEAVPLHVGRLLPAVALRSADNQPEDGRGQYPE